MSEPFGFLCMVNARRDKPQLPTEADLAEPPRTRPSPAPPGQPDNAITSGPETGGPLGALRCDLRGKARTLVPSSNRNLSMGILTNPFRKLLEGDHVPFGTWVSGATSIAEALGSLGFDSILVDMEHTPIDVPRLSILQALGGTKAAPIVRIAWNDRILVKRLMDAGAESLMFPFVQSVEEARAAVSFTVIRSPVIRKRRRGFPASTRQSYGTVPDYARRANEAAFVIVQIETPEAASKLEAIASVEGVDRSSSVRRSRDDMGHVAT